MSISTRADGPNTSDGEPIADESDIEELEDEIQSLRKKAWFWRITTGLITAGSLATRFLM